MRKLSFAVLLAAAVAWSATATAATPPPRFAGTWIITQGGMMSDGTPIPFDVFSVPEFMHVDPGNEIRATSGMFHASSLGTNWPLDRQRSMTVTVNASIGIGDWMVSPQGVVYFSYHALLYDASNKPIGYLHVVRTIDGPAGDLVPSAPTEEPLEPAAEDVLTGMAFIRFFDLKGQPLALPMGPWGVRMNGMAGPYRAVRAATGNLPE
jgi:hypothetical protein